jgi:hypothetical protein
LSEAVSVGVVLLYAQASTMILLPTTGLDPNAGDVVEVPEAVLNLAVAWTRLIPFVRDVHTWYPWTAAFVEKGAQFWVPVVPSSDMMRAAFDAT